MPVAVSRESGVQEYVSHTDLKTGFEARCQLECKIPHFRVEWIHWHSGFREAGLQVGDRIVAVEGKRVTTPQSMDELRKESQSAVGGIGESARFLSQGLKEGSLLSLTVRRRNPKGGWQELEIKGELTSPRSWQNSSNQPVYGMDGPVLAARDEFDDCWSTWYQKQMYGMDGPVLAARDEFDDCWSTWYQKQITAWSGHLNDGWLRTHFNSKIARTEHHAEKKRVDYLAARYPGYFSKTVKEDWQRVAQVLEGAVYDMKPEHLEYRRRGEILAQEIAALAKQECDAFLKTVEKEMVPAFPTVHPIKADPAKFLGKIVKLPAVGNRDWVTDCGRNYIVCSGDGGFYFIDAQCPAFEQILLANRRYERMVSPSLKPEFEVIGRVKDVPRVIVIRETGYTGFEVEPLAAMVGNAHFLAVKGEKSLFSGEEKLLNQELKLPKDDASPVEVMNTLFSAVKDNEKKTWESMFATWEVVLLDKGQALFYPYRPRRLDTDWIEARRRILERVYDLKVVWVGEIDTVLTGKEFKGAPKVEEVDVEVDHVGLMEGGEYRSHADSILTRLWTLQRVDNGPWRIITRACI